MTTYEKWARAFTIFAKYDPEDEHDVSAEHDVVYAGSDPAQVSDEDKTELETLGWRACEFDCFRKYV